MSADKRADFNKIDTDGDGFITADEFKASLQNGSGKVSDENVKVIVRMADENGDKKIDFDEYAKFAR
ncbi:MULTISPECIES: EF-hand domain-containing protein [unclassified Streptomyces]|uniref:EF-hand domain-containing protein n=1 Tax=unclassified Streptomyces TaxID=2593676 RepID=UPI00036E04DF|nr:MULTISPECIES: EF-hand domain-containing protein [unclassified Streptomyces]MYT31550.1 EF-hand domain-containing protein [Streptomyces sp. SID8354]